MTRAALLRRALAAGLVLGTVGLSGALRAHVGAPPVDACGGHVDKKGTYHCHKRGCEACHAKELAAAGPKAAEVQLIAFPGGEILLDGKPVGYDATGPVKIKPGTHEVTIKNRFLGENKVTIEISEGQTGKIVFNW
jgi:hypothetical protein